MSPRETITFQIGLKMVFFLTRLMKNLHLQNYASQEKQHLARNSSINLMCFSNNCESEELLLYQKALKHLCKLIKDLG